MPDHHTSLVIIPMYAQVCKRTKMGVMHVGLRIIRTSAKGAV